jgi:hypothetical protein
MDTNKRLDELAERARSATGGVWAVAAWTAYAEAVRAAANEIRGLEVADMVYLNGARMREIAEQVAEINGAALTRQAVEQWLALHGPKGYAVAVKTGARYEIRWVPVTGTVQTRRELLAAREQGQRVAPASWRIDENTRISGKQLWDRIGREVLAYV